LRRRGGKMQHWRLRLAWKLKALYRLRLPTHADQ